MKKLVLATFTFLFAISGFANHYIGGQIYWDAVGNGKYVFHLERIEECNMGFPPFQRILKSQASGVSIPVTLESTYQMWSNCACTYGTLQVQHFVSDTVSFTLGTALFDDIYYEECCRSTSMANTSDVGLVITSRFYNTGVNHSSARFDLVQMQNSGQGDEIHLRVLKPQADSTYFEKTTPVVGVINNVFSNATYSSGYSVNNQVSSTEVLDQAGLFKANSTTSGYYAISLQSEQYLPGGLKTADIRLETVLSILPQGSNSNNSPDDTTIVLSGNWSSINSQGFQTIAQPGDSLHLRFLSIDTDLDSNFQPQTITASMTGDIVSGNHGVSFFPQYPQGSLSSTYSNNVEFLWEVPAGMSPGIYNFSVQFVDDFCDQPGQTVIPFQVTIPGFTMKTDSLATCAGKSVKMASPRGGAVYSWTPTTGLSSPSSSVTDASPSSSTLYTITVDGVVAGEYYVDVVGSGLPIAATPTATSIEITNPERYDNHAFHYGYVPVSFNDTVLNTSATGLYHIVGQKLNCFETSSLVTLGQDTLQSFYMLSKNRGWDEHVVFDSSDTYDMSLRIGSDTKYIFARQFIIPGVQLYGANASVDLEVRGDAGYVDTIPGVMYGGHSMLFELPSNQSFTLSAHFILHFSGDSIRMPLMQNRALPYADGYYFVTAVSGSLNGSQLYDDIVPFFIKGGTGVDLDEWDGEDFVVFPQPATSQFTLEGVSERAEYSLYSITGSVVSSGVLGSDMTISVEDLPSGVYVIQIVEDGKVSSQKVQIQR